jgi:hypothetical protein
MMRIRVHFGDGFFERPKLSMPRVRVRESALILFGVIAVLE